MKASMGIPAPGHLDLFAVAGDSWSFEIEFKDQAGDPYPLSGTLWLANATDGTRTIPFSVDVSNVDTGKLVLTTDPTDTLNRSGYYDWDLQSIGQEGDIRTWLIGNLQVQRGVTP
jgi:hypothetical protein